MTSCLKSRILEIKRIASCISAYLLSLARQGEVGCCTCSGRGTADSKVLSSGDASILMGKEKWVVGSLGQLTLQHVISSGSEAQEKVNFIY